MLPINVDAGWVRVTAAAHPLRASRDIVMFREGPSLAEMLEHCQPDPFLRRHANIFIAGHRIDPAHWRRVYPKAGAHVEVRVLPGSGGSGGGGSKNIIRAVAMLAIVVVSIAAPYLAPGLATGLGAALGAGEATAFALGAALISASVNLVGTLLVNALVPIRPPKLGRQSDPQVWGIEGARNRLLPFQPVPQPLGRVRIAPPYGANPYTEILGSDQYVRLLFVWGVGPLSIDTSTLKIGETPLSDFEGVEIEHRQGFAGDAPLSLYPGTVTEDQLTVLLVDTTDGTGLTGPQLRTSAADADELGVDLSWPGGLYDALKDGGTAAESVTIRVRYRAVGAGSWLTPTFTAKTFPSSWISGSEIRFVHERKAAVRHGMRWDVPRGQYEVQVECTTVDDLDLESGANRAYWTALRTFTNEDPIQSRVPVAKTALRIKASDQLNGVIDELNAVVTTIGKDWDGNAWADDQEITNPASLFRHVLQGAANATPLADSRIDLSRLQEWHDFCAANGFTFSQVRDTASSVWDALADCAAAGRAAPAEPDGKWGVVIDRQQVTPVSHITPRNSFGFEAEKAFLELPHAFRISFPNQDEGYRLDERRIYRDGYDASNATRFETMEIPGVTDPDQIWKLGRYRLAQGIHQPERWRWRQDMEFLTYQRGDRVVVTHDVLLVGLKSGRVKSVTLDGSDRVTALELDETVTMQAGESYGIAIRTVAAAHVTAQVTTDPGDQATVTLTTPIPASGGQPAVTRGDLFGFGLLGQETDDALVIAMAPEGDLRALVTAVPYRDAVYTADTGTIPPFETNLTPLPSIDAPVVTSVVSDESVLTFGPGESLRSRIMIEVQRPAVADQLAGFRVGVQARPSTTGEPFHVMQVDERSEHHVIVSGVQEGQTWDVRIRFEAEGRLPGPWATVYNHRVVGRSTPPAGLSGLTISVFGGQAYLRWDAPTEIDVRYGGEVRFRHSGLFTGASWSESVSIGEAARSADLIANLPLKAGTYLARVFDSAGNPSTDIASVTTKQASVLTYAAYDSLDEAPTFGGTHSGTSATSGTLQLEASADFDSIPDFDAVEDVDAFGGVVSEGTYSFQFGFDFGAIQKVRLTTRITATSVSTLDTFDNRTDPIDEWEDFDGDTQGVGDVRIEVRHTDDDPAASPTWGTWERLDSAEFEARGFQFRAILTTTDPTYNTQVTTLGIDAEQIA